MDAQPTSMKIGGQAYSRIQASLDALDDGICPECGTTPGEVHGKACHLEICPVHTDRPMSACGCIGILEE